MIVTHEITVDLQERKYIPRIEVSQDDQYSRDVVITLLSGGRPWLFPEEASTIIRYCKSDGIGGVYDTLPNKTKGWHAEENLLTLALAPQVLTTAGPVMLSVTVCQGECMLTLCSLVIQVQPRTEAFYPESSPYYNVSAFLPGPVTARKGQFLRVAEVDDNGRVVAVEAAQVTLEPESGATSGEEDIPRLFFGEALPQTKDEQVMAFRFVSDTLDYSGWCKTKAQGNTSMAFPKKNQTVKLYVDAACSKKQKLSFRNWGPQSKFCCKANWIDLTHARNVVSARLWGDVIRSRADYSQLPEAYRLSPNQGAVDGFPVKLYAAGVYQGRYTLNIPKDPWMAGMDDSLDNHCILCGENYGSGCFRAEAKIDGTDWSDEVHDTVPASIKTRWNQVIDFVRNSTDEEFVRDIGNYFYLDSLIDYHLFGLMSCGLDAYGKNQLYMTYDGQKWIAGMYDMDATWGLWWNGGTIKPTTYDRSEYQDFKDGSGNLLYIRLEECFYGLLQERWQQLRSGALSMENIILRFEAFTDIAPEALVKEDYASTTGGGAFTGIPSKTANTLQQIRNFAVARHAWCDDYVASLTPKVTVSCTGISLNMMYLMLNVGDVEVLVPTVTPEDCTDIVVWESSDKSIAEVHNGTVTAVAGGTAVITAICGDYRASTEVTVKEGAPVVNCQGLSISAQSLIFTSEESQTLTVSVVPADCTDPVLWESSDENVARVENGVVTPVGNGSTMITVSCGTLHAECSVSVSGLADNLLRNAAWYVGEISETTGEIVDTVTAANYTDMIDLEGYQKTIIYGSCPGCNSIYSRMVMYTENMEFICSQKLDGYYEVPLNARYMRLSVYSGAGKTVTVISTKENLWDQLAIQEGAYPSGVYNPGDTNSCHIRIPVEEGALATVGAWGYACMDSSDAVLNYKTTHTGEPEGIPISEGVVCVAVCTNDANVGQITFCGWLKPIAYGTIQ